MKDSPLVSVVIPTFNQPDLLEEALATVFDQTFTDYEVIVVNDGSSPDTAARLAKYGSRISTITQTNQGIGAARNRGMAQAAGKFVAFLDHDDLWHPQKLAIQTRFMLAHPECIACSVPFAYSTQPQSPNFRLDIRDTHGIVRNPIARLADGEIFMQSSAMMIDRSATSDIRFEVDRECFEDIPFQIRLLLRGPYGIAGDEVLAIYRVHEGNATKSASHFFGGMLALRRLAASSGFGAIPHEQTAHVNAFLATLGRIACTMQIVAGKRSTASALYLSELPYQLRQGRLRFVMLFPLLVAMPKRLAMRLIQRPPR